MPKCCDECTSEWKHVKKSNHTDCPNFSRCPRYKKWLSEAWPDVIQTLKDNNVCVILHKDGHLTRIDTEISRIRKRREFLDDLFKMGVWKK